MPELSAYTPTHISTHLPTHPPTRSPTPPHTHTHTYAHTHVQIRPPIHTLSLQPHTKTSKGSSELVAKATDVLQDQAHRPSYLDKLGELVRGQEHAGALCVVHDVLNGVLTQGVVQRHAVVAHAVARLHVLYGH